MTSEVYSSSGSYDIPSNIKISVVFVSHDSSQKYLPYSDKNTKIKLKSYTTLVIIFITLLQAHAHSCSFLPFFKSHRFSYEREFYFFVISVLEIRGLTPTAYGSLGIYWQH